MGNVVGHLGSEICCVNLALVLFGCKRVWGMKGHLWHFLRKGFVMILSKSGPLHQTAVRSSLYVSFKFNLLTENYFDFVNLKCFRHAVIKLRMGVLPLNANRFRSAHQNTLKILCNFCENEIEDEIHFICFCPFYKAFWPKYMQSYLQSDHSFTLMMQSHEKIPCQNLAAFAFHGCKKRDIYMLLK